MAAYARLGALSLLWGSSFLLIKIAAGLLAPLGFALARVGVAAATLLLVAAASGRLWPGSRPGLWATLAGLSLLGQVAPFLLLGVAARLTTSADMALMMGVAPIFVFVAGRFAPSGDRWTLLGAFGLAVGFAGLGLALAAPAAAAAGGGSAIEGRAFALAAAFCYAMSALTSGPATREIGAVRAVAASMTLSTLLLGLAALAGAAPLANPAAESSPLAPLAAMAALGVFNTALAYFVYFRLIASEGPTFASLNNDVVPVVGVVGGAAALGESVAPTAWAGLALVLSGVVLTGRATRSGEGARSR
ncbi:EamA-like transporter family protein [Roseiarcus fermentans]|uniref:EamA-like transporter family protein n=1 Tax=Roseiarcus fermentans TaxID=1473586 RepID=A0A366EQF8_9HYPH|nr:DMT family transporter [Roseiarcus fermentans]RBP04186.1 EamA-like transporter family protein [Roseiarcus fermentans]